jgi:hypothetical protein
MCGNGEASANQHTSRGVSALKAGDTVRLPYPLRWRDLKKTAPKTFRKKLYVSESRLGRCLHRLVTSIISARGSPSLALAEVCAR